MIPLRQYLPLMLFTLLGSVVHAQGRPAPADASGVGSAEERVDGEARHDGISLDQAVRMAEAQFHARVVRTDVVDEDGRKVYVLKLLSEGGRVITVRVDAASGRMR